MLTINHENVILCFISHVEFLFVSNVPVKCSIPYNVGPNSFHILFMVKSKYPRKQHGVTESDIPTAIDLPDLKPH